MNPLKKIFSALLLGGMLVSTAALAQDDAAPVAEPEPDLRAEPQANLNQLLEFYKQGQVTESSENAFRDHRFAQANSDQHRLLNEAEDERALHERRSEQL